MRRTTPSEFRHRAASGGWHLLEVLPREAFAEAHIPGARCACVYEVTFLEQVRAHVPDMGAALVVYSSSAACRAAQAAAERLEAAGYRDVAILEGGKLAWQEAGYALEGRADRWVPRPPPETRDGERAVDVEKSVLEWTGRNANGKHSGTLRFVRGTVTVRGGALAAGSLEIDMRSLVDSDLADVELRRMLEAHLASEDFFAVARFPTARFEITRVAARVEGRLTLRGRTLPLAFAATVAPLAGGALALEAHFDFDRTLWGADYGAPRLYERLGMHAVDEGVSVQVRIVAV